MAKKGKQTKKPAEAAEPDNMPAGGVSPKFGDYLKATTRVVLSWLKSHKLLALAALVVISATIAGVILITGSDRNNLSNDAIVTRVNKELGISGDGNPAILTVEDKTKATQPFLDQAQNGDKVLLYYKARKAVLFRPSENSVIHQGSYTPPDAKVFIRKGTSNNTKVDEAKKRLEGVNELDLVSQDDSAKKDYQGITLVNITDRYDDKLRELEQLFGVKTVRLPAGETFPDADILVIVGS